MWGFPKPIFKPHEYWLCKACCCNSTYRLRYWNHNDVVAPVLTTSSCNSTYRLRYWNETEKSFKVNISRLQQYLPLAVLKLSLCATHSDEVVLVCCNSTYRLRYWNNINIIITPSISLVATVLTACGIETDREAFKRLALAIQVATVLTACGIETFRQPYSPSSFCLLQQYLPLAVLKRSKLLLYRFWIHSCNSTYRLRYWNPQPESHLLFSVILLRVATVLTACGIETNKISNNHLIVSLSCNSTYRLRYWNKQEGREVATKEKRLQQYLPLAVLKRPLT